jgi:hypothetical protein
VGTVESMGFLEMNGKDRNKPDELKAYLWNDYVLVCVATPDTCNFKIGIVTAEGIEASQSADLKRADMSRI